MSATTVATLCSGIGGDGLALEALGFTVTHHAELDPAASAVLARRWPGVPNLGNVRHLDLDALAGVDAIAAGYPCQPFSLAGRRKGHDDPRHLWPAIRDAVASLRPRLLFLENVRGHLTLGWPEVRADLDAIGYVGAWGVLGSSAVGGCHRRERLWIVATPDPGRRARREEPVAEPGRGDPLDPRQHRPPPPHARHDGREGREERDVPAPGGPPASQRPDPDRRVRPPRGVGQLLPTPAAADGARGPDLARAARPESGGMDLVTVATRLLPTPVSRDWKGRNQRDDATCLPGAVATFGEYAAAVDRWAAIFGPPPPPTLDTYKGARKHYDQPLGLDVAEVAPGRCLNPAFPEWMMGFPPGWATELIPDLDAFRVIGNAQQPQVAACAWAQLLDRLEQVAVPA